MGNQTSRHKAGEPTPEGRTRTSLDDREELRSGYGSIPGAEFPAAIYWSVIFGFTWMLVAAWLSFGGLLETDLDLGIVTLLCIVFLALPILIYRTATARSQPHQSDLREFLSSHVDTAMGTVPAREAWLQVALIPLALAVAATVIGGVYVWFG